MTAVTKGVDLEILNAEQLLCIDSDDCDDGDFCNGSENCVNGSCRPGSDPCPGQMCDEANDACVDCLEDGDCDDGDFCNGAEKCQDGVCLDGPDPCVDAEHCDEASDVCLECLDDNDCTGGEVCNPATNQCEPAPTLLTFQQGTDGYAGTSDTYLAEQTPSTSYGSATDVQWDTSWGSTGDEAIGLIRFEGVFGSGYGQVPVGAQITSATLTVFVYDTGDYGSMREVLVDWNESVTYNGFGGDPGAQTNEYGSQVAIVPGTYGVHAIDLTGSLQTWANDPAGNFGWIILPSGSGGTKIRSSEYATVADRPLLTVEFTAECLDDGDCDDGEFCNGSETCEDGTCMSGAVPCSAYEQCNDQFEVCEGIVCEGGIAPFLPPQQTGSITSGAITEASGLAASRQNPGVLWTHNDSGGGNVVYAITTSGNLLGTYTFGSGSAWDTEDIAIGPGPEPGVDYIYWGDIGDNGNVRSSIVVKRAPEPAVDPNQGPVNDTLQDVGLITLQYPTGIHAPSEKDAETMFVDPVNGDIYVVTKRAVPNKVYRAPYPQSTSSPTTLEWVTDLPSEFNGTPGSWNGGPTGGDVSPDGSVIVIRQYSSKTPPAAFWYRPLGTDLASVFDEPYCTMQIQSDGAGEAICWDRDGQGVYTTQDENSNPPLRYYERNSD